MLLVGFAPWPMSWYAHLPGKFGQAVVGLEQVLDAVTAVSLAVSRGASAPSPSGVRLLCAALHAVSEAASAGTPLPARLELPDDETLEPITEAVRALFGVLASGERLGGPAT